MLRRNNPRLKLVSNGPRRPGQYEWHNEHCLVEDYGIELFSGKPSHYIWCATHGQWASECPVKVVYYFQDGTLYEKELK